MSRKKKHRSKRPTIEVNVEKLDGLVDKACKEPLSSEEGQLLKGSIHALVEQLMPKPRTSEKAADLLDGKAEDEDANSADAGRDASTPSPAPEKKKAPGHGRNGANDYFGAKFVSVRHQELHPQCPCPECLKGKLYRLKETRPIIRVVAMAPIQATVYQLEGLRCNLCLKLFPAAPPEGIGEEKYDESVASMESVLHYGQGLPFNRIEKLQQLSGVPLPSSTQFELLDEAAEKLKPVYDELVRLAAQGEVHHVDDTCVRILDAVERPPEQKEDRTGLQTTGIVSQVGEHRIGLFKSGPKHAGENMADLLVQRQPGLPAPMLMSDALSANRPKLPPEFETVILNCLVHGRRQFVDVYEAFPDECGHVIRELGKVYGYDAQARENKLDNQARLLFHKEHSGPIMDALKTWMVAKLEDKKTEPNSGLGKAIRYCLKRWDRLTRFLEIPGAPLDNNVAERALKKAVLVRKNSLFYKTLHGAEVGDLHLTLNYTCELNGVNPFEFLTAVQRHHLEAAADPGAWLPWNYRLQLARAPA